MLVQLGDNERLRNFCTQCRMLNHEVTDFPLGFGPSLSAVWPLNQKQSIIAYLLVSNPCPFGSYQTYCFNSTYLCLTLWRKSWIKRKSSLLLKQWLYHFDYLEQSPRVVNIVVASLISEREEFTCVWRWSPEFCILRGLRQGLKSDLYRFCIVVVMCCNCSC